ncbi:unnamed protein product [Thlaspi arvense]|uniref:Exportin-1/Importin-beta-like domain-containing protein n=1 Tax=Thlaspi arvense TaxID=13288 RepID=A0AAU9S0X9_THLAR|nr:unnamed protein product [Thlaspi arvense]
MRRLSYKPQDLCNCDNEEFCVIKAIRSHIEPALTTSTSPYYFFHNLNCANLVQHIFGGRLVSGLRFCNCNSVSETFENSLALSLEIGDVEDLWSALYSFTLVEKLEDDCPTLQIQLKQLDNTKSQDEEDPCKQTLPISDVADFKETETSAALVAEIVRREGPNLWQEIFALLTSLSAQGPLQAELVLMTLRWPPEDITVDFMKKPHDRELGQPNAMCDHCMVHCSLHWR